MIPKMMKAMVLTGHGGLDKLEWRENVPVPKPGPKQVLIRVGASAVNNTDINTRTGWYSKSVRGDTAEGARSGYGADTVKDGSWSGVALNFPRIQGADCCGTIVAVGTGVNRDRVGARVLVRALQSPPTESSALSTITFGSECDGGFAEYCVVSTNDAVAINSPLTDVELASFPCAFSTAEGMIQRASIKDERVLITGASGGVGSAAIQLAKRRGAHVTVVTQPEKATLLKELGADAVIGRDSEFPVRSFDVVLDLVGGPTWAGIVESLRDGGRYAVAGAIAGPVVELDLRTLYLRDLSFFGCTHQDETIFTDLVRYIEQGEIRPVIAETFALQDLPDAQQAFLSKKHIGKVALSVGG